MHLLLLLFLLSPVRTSPQNDDGKDVGRLIEPPSRGTLWR